MSENFDLNGAIVVFGLDGKRRPRAGVFDANHAEAATERGRAHNFVVMPVSTDALVEAVQGLSPGDLAADETKFIPSVARPVYDKLLAASGILRKDQDQPTTPYTSRLSAPPVLPTSFSDSPTSVVVANLVAGPFHHFKAASSVPGLFGPKRSQRRGLSAQRLCPMRRPQAGSHERRNRQLENEFVL